VTWRNFLSKATHFSLTGQTRCSLDKLSEWLTHNLHLRILVLFSPVLSSNLSFLHPLTLTNILKVFGCSFTGKEIKYYIFQRAWYCITTRIFYSTLFISEEIWLFFPCLMIIWFSISDKNHGVIIPVWKPRTLTEDGNDHQMTAAEFSTNNFLSFCKSQQIFPVAYLRVS